MGRLDLKKYRVHSKLKVRNSKGSYDKQTTEVMSISIPNCKKGFEESFPDRKVTKIWLAQK